MCIELVRLSRNRDEATTTEDEQAIRFEIETADEDTGAEVERTDGIDIHVDNHDGSGAMHDEREYTDSGDAVIDSTFVALDEASEERDEVLQLVETASQPNRVSI